MSEISLWDDTAAAATADHVAHRQRVAVAAVEPLRGYLHSSHTPMEFAHRLAMAEGSIARMLTEVGAADMADTARTALSQGFAEVLAARDAQRAEAAFTAALRAAAGQVCPSCKGDNATWEPVVPEQKDEDGEIVKALYCPDCDYGVDKVEHHGSKQAATAEGDNGQCPQLVDGVRCRFPMGHNPPHLPAHEEARVTVANPSRTKAAASTCPNCGSERTTVDGWEQCFVCGRKRKEGARTKVYEGTSSDYNNDTSDGPDYATLTGLVGKYVAIVFFNEHGVAADHEVGRIVEVSPNGSSIGVRTDLPVIEWHADGGHQYPIEADQIYRIERLEEPVDAGQQSLFAKRTAAGNWIDKARSIVANHQYERIDGVMLDATTAGMLVQIADALSPEKSAQFTSMSLQSAVDFGWKIIKRLDEGKSYWTRDAHKTATYLPTGETYESPCDTCGVPVVFEWYENEGGFRASEAVDSRAGSDYLSTWCPAHRPARRQTVASALPTTIDAARLNDLFDAIFSLFDGRKGNPDGKRVSSLKDDLGMKSSHDLMEIVRDTEWGEPGDEWGEYAIEILMERGDYTVEEGLSARGSHKQADLLTIDGVEMRTDKDGYVGWMSDWGRAMDLMDEGYLVSEPHNSGGLGGASYVLTDKGRAANDDAPQSAVQALLTEAGFFRERKERKQQEYRDEQRRGTEDRMRADRATRDPKRLSYDDLQKAHGEATDETRRKQIADEIGTRFDGAGPGVKWDGEKAQQRHRERVETEGPGYKASRTSTLEVCPACKGDAKGCPACGGKGVKMSAVALLLMEADAHDSWLPGGHLGDEEVKFEVVSGDEVLGQYATREDAEDKVRLLKEDDNIHAEVKEISKTGGFFHRNPERDPAEPHPNDMLEPMRRMDESDRRGYEHDRDMDRKREEYNRQHPDSQVERIGSRTAAGYGIPDPLDGIVQPDEFAQTQQPLTTRPRVLPREHEQAGLPVERPTVQDAVAPDADPLTPSIAQRTAARIARLAQRVQRDNPTLSTEQARAVAAQTVRTYPEMLEGTR